MSTTISPPQRPERIKLTKETFLNDISLDLKEKYTFEDIPEFPRKRDKITLVCSIHGKQPKTVLHILNGSGCKQCGIDARSGINSQEFQKRIVHLRQTLGNLYNDLKFEHRCSRQTSYGKHVHGNQTCYHRNENQVRHYLTALF